MSFDIDYLIMDEFGVKQVLCMSCGIPIKTRSEIKSMIDPRLVIREMAKHPEYKEMGVILSDGNVCFIMICDGCKFNDIEPEKISQQLQNAYRTQFLWEGKDKDLVEEVLKTNSRKVIRKADTFEMAKALKG